MPRITQIPTPEINYLQIGGRKVFFLHESNSLLADLLEFDMLNDSSCVVCTYSWYSDEIKYLSFRNHFDELKRIFPHKYDLLSEKVIFAGNSLSEYLFIKQIMPIKHAIFFNNAATISEKVFTIGSETRIFEAAMNAKPNLFKRHYLLGDTSNWLFLSYGLEKSKNNPDFVDITRLPHAKLVTDVPDYKVAAWLNRCHVGVALSEVEGICGASLEYLLAGLPVVSTKSLGGRDEFYNANNAVIVAPRTEEIMAAVSKLVSQSKRGEINRDSIREIALEKVKGFRQTLANSISDCIEVPVDRVLIELTEAIWASNKLAKFRNAWKTSTRRERA